jgi:CubicO group peptidase (beta-lactamase class C family)
MSKKKNFVTVEHICRLRAKDCMRQIKTTAACLLIMLSSYSVNSQSKSSQQITRFVAEVTDLQKKLKIPGLSLAIVKDQKLLYATGLGWADIENKVPATKNTLYSIASVTKTFTSTLLMQLVEKGQLNLDAPMSQFHAGIKSDSLKVHHFLTHTSEGKPGEQYRYSGDRFVVLQKVIEKVTKKSYQALVVENIFSKAGMKESVPGQDVMENDSRYAAVRKQYAKPYTLYGTDQMILSPYPYKTLTASAGLLSNVTDLAKYDIALDKHLFISAATQEKAWTPFTLTDGTTSPYGYGWFVQNYKGMKTAWHYGQWPTYTALYLKVPEQNITLIMLANSDGLSKPFGSVSGNVFNSAFALAFFRHFLTPTASVQPVIKWNTDSTTFKQQIKKLQTRHGANSFLEEINSYNMITRYLLGREQRVRKQVEIDTRLYKDYAGTYELLPAPLKVYVQGNKLMAEGPTLSSGVELFPEMKNKFFLKILNVQVEFMRNKDGIVDECILYIDGNKYRCRKLSS